MRTPSTFTQVKWDEKICSDCSESVRSPISPCRLRAEYVGECKDLPSSPTNIITGGDGSTIHAADGSTFTYNNKFGGFCKYFTHCIHCPTWGFGRSPTCETNTHELFKFSISKTSLVS